MLRLAAKRGIGDFLCAPLYSAVFAGGRADRYCCVAGRSTQDLPPEDAMSVLPKGVLLGAIADDFTGATDLCNTLVRRGMRTVQLIGVPEAEGNAPPPDADAVVV